MVGTKETIIIIMLKLFVIWGDILLILKKQCVSFLKSRIKLQDN